jgi:HK97 family phage portal protein
MGLFDIFKRKTFDASSLVGIRDGILYSLQKHGYSLDWNSHFAINRGIKLKANTVASIPLKLWFGDKEIDIATPLKAQGGGSFSLKNPHSDISLYELLQTCVSYYEYLGEFFLYIDQAAPFSIEPLNPKLITRQNGSWKYGNSKTIPDENLIHIKQFHPDTLGKGVRGQGIMALIDRELNNDLYALKYSESFWQNFSIIGGHITVKDGRNLDPQRFRQIVKDFSANHAGANKAGKVAGIPDGLEYTPSTTNMIDNSIIPLRQETTKYILNALGVNKALLGIDAVNRSVAEEATRTFYSLTIIPDCKRLEDKLNQTFMRNWFPGYKISFDFSDIKELQDNRESLLNQAAQLQRLGYTIDEINTHLNLDLPEMGKENDIRFISSGLVPLDYYKMTNDEPAPSKSIDLKDDDVVTLIENKSVTKTPSGLFIAKYNKLLIAQTNTVSRKFSSVFSKQRIAILKALYKNKKSIEINVTGFLDDVERYLYAQGPGMVKKFRTVYSRVSESADEFAIDALGAGVSATDYAAAVEGRLKYISAINDTTFNKIKNSTLVALNEGQTLDDLAETIKTYFNTASTARKVIARTETGSIISATTHKRYQTEGVQRKSWVSAGDEEVRESHVRNAQEGSVPFDAVYPNGMQYPMDQDGAAAEVINCRCVLVPEIK